MIDAPIPLTILIILITTLVSMRGFNHPEFRARFIFDVQLIQREHGYIRLITSGFLHASWMHLIFNMLSLFFFGRYVEIVLGAQLYILLYLMSLLGGGLLSLYLNWNTDYSALGASGAVSGIIFACIFIFPGGSVYIFPLPFPIPSWLYAILFVVISLYGIRSNVGNIGHDAHLGGALSGLLVTAVLVPQAILNNMLLFIVILGLVIISLIYIHKKINPFI
jgi:membrane associated rhomboid family serine protease